MRTTAADNRSAAKDTNCAPGVVNCAPRVKIKPASHLSAPQSLIDPRYSTIRAAVYLWASVLVGELYYKADHFLIISLHGTAMSGEVCHLPCAHVLCFSTQGLDAIYRGGDICTCQRIIVTQFLLCIQTVCQVVMEDRWAYSVSAFWLRSKCRICSYQLTIWYVPHWGYFNWPFDLMLIFGTGKRHKNLLQLFHGSAWYCSTSMNDPYIIGGGGWHRGAHIPYPRFFTPQYPISQIFKPQYPISQIFYPPISHIPDFTVNWPYPRFCKIRMFMYKFIWHTIGENGSNFVGYIIIAVNILVHGHLELHFNNVHHSNMHMGSQ